jgi:protein-S-isoprenylcysteine O-methyltransferase Ste14
MTTEQINNQPAPSTNSSGSIDMSKLVIRFGILFALPAVILFGAAGRLDWWMAWLYIIVASILVIASRIWVLRVNPGLAEERIRALDKEDTKSWDKILVPIITFIGPIVIMIVAGLDMRNDWSPKIASWLQIVAFGLLVMGYLVGTWAMMANNYFSAMVRIQKDRGHTVVSTGPYRFVRHPGYMGAVIANIGIPIMLDSLWALIPTVLLIGVTVIRTALEDRTLQAELDGYKDYAQKVRYRLFPGVW